VATTTGSVAIASLRVGDTVEAYDPQTGETGPHTVTAVMVNTDPAIEHLRLDTGSIETTPNHPFFTADRGWVQAGSLAIGELIRTDSGRFAAVLGFTVEATPSTMWDLTVDGAHSFFVGPGAVLVHNCGGAAMQGDARVAAEMAHPPVGPGRVIPFVRPVFDAPDPLSVPLPPAGGPMLQRWLAATGIAVGFGIASDLIPGPKPPTPVAPCRKACMQPGP
jgi:hypothetical protein